MTALLLTATILSGQVLEHPGYVGPPVLVSFDPTVSHPAASMTGTPATVQDEVTDTPDPQCSRVGTFTRAELGECFGPWAGIAWCESGGDSQALNPKDTDGLPAFGLFQFKQATWNATAAHAGRLELVGVDPRTLPASVQYDMATHHAESMGNGLAPWGCGHAFG